MPGPSIHLGSSEDRPQIVNVPSECNILRPKREHKHKDPTPRFLESPVSWSLEPECRIPNYVHVVIRAPKMCLILLLDATQEDGAEQCFEPPCLLALPHGEGWGASPAAVRLCNLESRHLGDHCDLGIPTTHKALVL